MTESANSVIESTDTSVTPDGRLDRVLDAAAELLVRWGYQRVTIEEVAKRAGIGKGTVYLHFRTKEALFLTVLLRAQHAVLHGMAGRMRAEPVEVLPGRMMASVYRALAGDPVTRRIYLGDDDTLGRLAHEAAATLGELGRRREVVLREHLGLLREAGLLRADLDLSAQRYLLSAVATGFFLTDPLALPGAPADPAVRAELLEHAVASALRTATDARPGTELAETVAARYESLLEHIEDEWRRRVR